MGDSNLEQLAEDAKREATIAEMTCDGWDLQGEDTFEKIENFGESYSKQVVRLDGSASATGSTLGTAWTEEYAESMARAASDKLASVRGKWDQKINDVMRGWDWLPEPSTFDGVIGKCQEAAQKVASGRGNDTTLGNPELSELGFISRHIPQNSGHTVATFDRLYGPDKIEVVLDAHCEAVGALGAALLGQQKVWKATKEDVASIMTSAVEGFKQTRNNNDSSWQSDLKVAVATIGLLSAFTAGVPGLAPLLAAASATGGFIATVAEEVEKTNKAASVPAEGTYSGSHPDDVYTDLESAFRGLNERVVAQETGLRSMLTTMLGLVNDNSNRANFHINPGQGLAPDFRGDDVVDMKYGDLEIIGYTSMPVIAKAFFNAADGAFSADDQSVWYRPYASVIGDSIGLDAYGAYYEWRDLLHAVYPLMNDTGAEIIRAGEHLAEAAGYMRETDQWVKDKLGEDYRDVENAELGWQQPYEPPPPPPVETPRGGRQLAI